jgi:RNA polymerase sigma factor (TIGR02999 family)
MSDGTVTRLLHRLEDTPPGEDRRELFNQLVSLVYDDMRRNARRILGGERTRSLQPTDVVHEAYRRLVGLRMNFNDRRHFMAVAATAMRRFLIDRRRRFQPQLVPLDFEAEAVADIDRGRAIAVNHVLESGALTPTQVELVELRYYVGFTFEEIGEILDLKPDTVKKRWRVVKTLLADALAGLKSS